MFGRTSQRVALVATPFALLALTAAAVQDVEPPPATAPALDPYPPLAPEANYLAFALTGDVDEAQLVRAVEKLGEGARVVSGPSRSRARPSNSFVAVSVPAGTKARAVRNAVKKGARKAEALRWTILAWDPEGGGEWANRGAPGAGRQWIVGMDADLRWYDGAHGQAIFYYVDRKLDATTLLERFERLAEGYLEDRPDADVLRESFTWELATPVDPKRARKAEKAVGKLAGIESASIDDASGTLFVTVMLADLDGSGAPLRAPAWPVDTDEPPAEDAEPVEPPWRPRYDVGPVLAALEKAGVEVLPPPEGPR